MAASQPPLTIAARIPGSAHLSNAFPDSPQVLQHTRVEADRMTWSRDGALLAAVSGGTASLYSGESGAKIGQVPAEVVYAAFSPGGKYLVTFAKASKDSGDRNLKVWKLHTDEVIMQLFQKVGSGWPNFLAFTSDDAAAFHIVTNAVNIYDPTDFAAGVQRKLALKGVAGFAVSPGPTPFIAAYVPESKGSPGFVGVWDHASLTKGETPPPLARRSFYRANAAQLMWNSKGTAVLALTASDVDATNQSYYGEQKLMFLAANGSNDCLVPLPKEGPIHDVQWAPSGEVFVAVAGFMPAKTTLFSDTCKPLYDLGAGPHNIVRWNPQSRFLVLCGFGNLPGDVAFFERHPDNKCKQLGARRLENGVTVDWAPDGRHVMVATTSPRLRVDNGLFVVKYDATVVAERKFEVLLEATWRPAPLGTYPDRPKSPKRGGAGGAAESPNIPPKPVAFVPPQLRGDPAAAAAARASFSLARDESDKPGRLGVPQGRALPPGAAPPLSKSAAKNAKRRAKKTGEGPRDGIEAPGDDATPSGNGHAGGGAAAAEPTVASDSAESAAGGAEAVAASGDKEDIKKIRNLQKKLRQIEELKSKQAAGGTLEPEQKVKLTTEASLLEELRKLSTQ